MRELQLDLRRLRATPFRASPAALARGGGPLRPSRESTVVAHRRRGLPELEPHPTPPPSPDPPSPRARRRRRGPALDLRWRGSLGHARSLTPPPRPLDFPPPAVENSSSARPTPPSHLPLLAVAGTNCRGGCARGCGNLLERPRPSLLSPL
jgi:hypothetical protein